MARCDLTQSPAAPLRRGHARAPRAWRRSRRASAEARTTRARRAGCAGPAPKAPMAPKRSLTVLGNRQRRLASDPIVRCSRRGSRRRGIRPRLDLRDDLLEGGLVHRQIARSIPGGALRQHVLNTRGAGEHLRETRIRGRYRNGNAARTVGERGYQVPVDVLAAALELLLHRRRQRLVEELALRLAPVARVVLQHVIGLQVQLALAPAEGEWLVHHSYLSSDRHHVEELLDVFRIEPDATVARAQADACGLVGSVD